MGDLAFSNSIGAPGTLYNVNDAVSSSGALEGYLGFPFYSGTLDVPTGGTITCTNTGTVTIQIYAPDDDTLPNQQGIGPAAGSLVQTISLQFPSMTLPVPDLAPLVKDGPSDVFDYRDIGQRFSKGYGSTDSEVDGIKWGWITGHDVVRGLVLDASKADARLVAASTNVPSSYFTPGPNYTSTTAHLGHGLVSPDRGNGNFNAIPYPYYGTFFGKLVPNVTYSSSTTLTGTTTGATVNDLTDSGTSNLQPVVDAGGLATTSTLPIVFTSLSPGSANAAAPANGVFAGGGTSTVPGDWDTGVGYQPDGAYINKVDEGDLVSSGSQSPYFASGSLSSTVNPANFFSPNRQMPSPVMFGSLPTGVISQKPWQTLLFRPDPGGIPQHVGAQSPPDYLLLDLFTMPVVEPYPISDPFSTAGKINMNYQIVPFTYITRSTGIQAVLKSEQMLAIPPTDGATYKTSKATNRRYFIDLGQTLNGFTQRFANSDIFRSASEICGIWLVPAGSGDSYSQMQSFWTAAGSNSGALTGDNARERPYANIYPRLTTKSNTFTVHYRVQTLQKIKTDPNQGQWVEGQDVVTGEARGSVTLERYLDTSDTRIPDYATETSPNPEPIDDFYKFRVIESKQFTP